MTALRHVTARATPWSFLLALCLLLPLGCGSGTSDIIPDVSANCGCHAAGAVGVPGTTPSGLMSAAEIALCEEVFAQVNDERMARGLTPLLWHPGASDVAYAHTVYQEGIGTITHDGPGGCVAPTDCLAMRLATGGVTGFSAWGENVARGQQTAQEVMCDVFGWMNSQGHCENILTDGFTHIGMAVRTGALDGPYWTQVFLRIP